MLDSLGHTPRASCRTDPLCLVVRRCVQNGIVVVCSSGNRGKDPVGTLRYGGITPPGIEPSAKTVGASNSPGAPSWADDTVCTFSSRGPTYLDQNRKPDLVAPGNNIVAAPGADSSLDVTLPANRVAPSRCGGSGSDRTDFRLSGAGMAAPHVAAIAALMIEKNPGLKPNTEGHSSVYRAETAPGGRRWAAPYRRYLPSYAGGRTGKRCRGEPARQTGGSAETDASNGVAADSVLWGDHNLSILAIGD